MVDPTSDLLLVVVLPVTMIIIAALYKVAEIWLESRDDCQHTWSRWSEPQKGEGHPYQTRSCNKCNMHQSRLVQ